MNISGRRRFSAPFFLGADATTIMSPWPGVGTENAAERFPPISQMDYLKDRYGGTFVAKEWSGDVD